MKRLLTEIEYCYCLIAFFSLVHAIPINLVGDYSGIKSFNTDNINSTNNANVCIYENAIYAEGQNISTSNPCETCTCDPPGFSCSLRRCDLKPGCKAIHKANKCCPDYVCECERNGKIYANGEKVEEPNPCKVCYCKGGEIKCALVTCYTRDDCEPGYVAGVCCPKYDHCPPLEMMKNNSTTPAPALVIISDLKTESANPVKHKDLKKSVAQVHFSTEPTTSTRAPEATASEAPAEKFFTSSASMETPALDVTESSKVANKLKIVATTDACASSNQTVLEWTAEGTGETQNHTRFNMDTSYETEPGNQTTEEHSTTESTTMNVTVSTTMEMENSTEDDLEYEKVGFNGTTDSGMAEAMTDSSSVLVEVNDERDTMNEMTANSTEIALTEEVDGIFRISLDLGDVTTPEANTSTTYEEIVPTTQYSSIPYKNATEYSLEENASEENATEEDSTIETTTNNPLDDATGPLNDTTDAFDYDNSTTTQERCEKSYGTTKRNSKSTEATETDRSDIDLETTTDGKVTERADEKSTVVKVIVPKIMKKDVDQVQKNSDGQEPVVVMISAEQMQFLKLAEEPPMYVENRKSYSQIREHDHIGIVVVPKTTPTTVEMVKVVAGQLYDASHRAKDAKSITNSHSFNSTDFIHER